MAVVEDGCGGLGRPGAAVDVDPGVPAAEGILGVVPGAAEGGEGDVVVEEPGRPVIAVVGTGEDEPVDVGDLEQFLVLVDLVGVGVGAEQRQPVPVALRGLRQGVQEAVEELLVDPDAPERGNTTPPQTIDAEPSRIDKDAR